MFIQSGELVIIFRHNYFRKLFKSLRFWLLLSFVIIGIIPTMIHRSTLRKELKKAQVLDRIKEVQIQCGMLRGQIMKLGYLENSNNEMINEVINNVIKYVSNIFEARMMIVDKNFKIIKDTYGMEKGKINISEAVLLSFRGNAEDRYQIEDKYVELIFPLYETLSDKKAENKEKKVEGVLVVIVSTKGINEFADGLLEKTQLIELVTFLFLLLAAFVLSHLLVSPFRALIVSLNHVADDNLEEKVAVNTFSETKEISDSISRTMSRLKILDESRQEFVSNVSHELKTPITSIRVLADSLMVQEEIPVELYREFMTDISEEIDRESKIIDDLLSLVKMDKSTAELMVVPVVMNELLKLILKRLRPIANRRNIELVFESLRPVSAEIDEVKITLALSNLIENAIKYNITDGWVRITLDADHKFCYVKVVDSGLGIPEEFQSHIFERFYRVDKARSREKGGTGLGLSIAKSVILLHHGAIKVSSKENEGTTFTVRIPLTYIA